MSDEPKRTFTPREALAALYELNHPNKNTLSYKGEIDDCLEVLAHEIAANEILRRHIRVNQDLDMTASIDVLNKEITVGEGIILADWLCSSKNKPEPMRFVTTETLDMAFHIFELTKQQKEILQNILKNN